MQTFYVIGVVRNVVKRLVLRPLLFWAAIVGSMQLGVAQEPATQGRGELRNHITFLSTFDKTTSAEIAKGDDRLFTADSLRSLDDATQGLTDTNVENAKGQ